MRTVYCRQNEKKIRLQTENIDMKKRKEKKYFSKKIAKEKKI